VDDDHDRVQACTGREEELRDLARMVAVGVDRARTFHRGLARRLSRSR
jgi:hypothetical protein